MRNLTKKLAEKARSDFPIFTNNSNDEKTLIYLDHAATSQKPKQVIEALKHYYSRLLFGAFFYFLV